MNNPYTENLEEFGLREIAMLNDTLTAWLNTGLPEDFYHSGVKPAMNKNSGFVFLINDEYQVVMLNEGKLEIFHSLPYSGIEGFLSEIMADNSPDDLNADDLEYIETAIKYANIEIPEQWQF